MKIYKLLFNNVYEHLIFEENKMGDFHRLFDGNLLASKWKECNLIRCYGDRQLGDVTFNYIPILNKILKEIKEMLINGDFVR